MVNSICICRSECRPKLKCLINETTFIYGGAVMKNPKSTKEGTFVLIKNELFPEIVICFTML